MWVSSEGIGSLGTRIKGGCMGYGSVGKCLLHKLKDLFPSTQVKARSDDIHL